MDQRHVGEGGRLPVTKPTLNCRQLADFTAGKHHGVRVRFESYGARVVHDRETSIVADFPKRSEGLSQTRVELVEVERFHDGSSDERAYVQRMTAPAHGEAGPHMATHLGDQSTHMHD